MIKLLLCAIVAHTALDGKIGRQCDSDTGFVGSCGNCLSSSQCQNGMTCCPFMKKCIASSSQQCSLPIAKCSPMCHANPDSCTCESKDFPNNWVTCSAPAATKSPMSPQSPTPQAPNPVSGPKLWAAVLKKHNDYRCLHGVPNLEWDDTIANRAQSWADTTNGKMKHSTSQFRSNVAGFQHLGENLAGGAPERAVEMWYSEIKHTPGGKGKVNEFNMKTGHYSQVVWKETTKLGCGEKSGLVVCMYGKGGNMGGAFQQNVQELVPAPKCEGSKPEPTPTTKPDLITNRPEATPTPTLATATPTLATAEPTKATATPTLATEEPTLATVAPTKATAEPTLATSEPTKATAAPSVFGERIKVVFDKMFNALDLNGDGKVDKDECVKTMNNLHSKLTDTLKANSLVNQITNPERCEEMTKANKDALVADILKAPETTLKSMADQFETLASLLSGPATLTTKEPTKATATPSDADNTLTAQINLKVLSDNKNYCEDNKAKLEKLFREKYSKEDVENITVVVTCKKRAGRNMHQERELETLSFDVEMKAEITAKPGKREAVKTNVVENAKVKGELLSNVENETNVTLIKEEKITESPTTPLIDRTARRKIKSKSTLIDVFSAILTIGFTAAGIAYTS